MAVERGQAMHTQGLIALENSMASTMSDWFDAKRIPQDFLTGIIVTIIGLAILFRVKPRMSIDLVHAKSESQEAYTFRVTNSTRMQVIEVKARVFIVDASTDPPTRRALQLKVSELFQLSGRRTPEKKRSGIFGEKNQYIFLPQPPLEGTKVGECEFLLFQVYAKHGFSNFGNVTRKRWINRDANLVEWSGNEDDFEGCADRKKIPQRPARLIPVVLVVTGISIAAARWAASVLAAVAILRLIKLLSGKKTRS